MEWERTLVGGKKTASSSLLAQEHPSSSAPAPAASAELSAPTTAAGASPPTADASGPAQSKTTWGIPSGAFYQRARDFLFGMRA
jgi:hypothetical protein